MGRHHIAEDLADEEVPTVVTQLLADYRAQAALAVVSVLGLVSGVPALVSMAAASPERLTAVAQWVDERKVTDEEERACLPRDGIVVYGCPGVDPPEPDRPAVPQHAPLVCIQGSESLSRCFPEQAAGTQINLNDIGPA
jgi:hypothetical protein